MALYVVLHHRRDDDPHERWNANKWQDDERIESITTTPEIAMECHQATTVYVHRCGWKRRGAKYVRPVICCSAQVAKVDGSPAEPTVHFFNVEVVGAPVKKRLYGLEKPFYKATAP